MGSIIYAGIDVHKDTYCLCSFDGKNNLLLTVIYDNTLCL